MAKFTTPRPMLVMVEEHVPDECSEHIASALIFDGSMFRKHREASRTAGRQHVPRVHWPYPELNRVVRRMAAERARPVNVQLDDRDEFESSRSRQP